MIEQDVLEEILSCPGLPSLPLVAVRVIELSGDTDVCMDELAEAIQNDQALSAKVLRTVNSSFYGLRQQCSTIRKALVMLGLGPVKSLALGFSLVTSLEIESEPKFDYVAYWRRAMYTAVAARSIARRVAPNAAEEAFLGGLLQDLGMIAMHRALGDAYLEVVALAEGDHNAIARHELEHLGVQHAEIGAMLASRWRLPPALTLPIKYHERPTASPNECAAQVRCVGLGNLVHDALTNADPGPPLRRYYERAMQWFRMVSDDAETVLREVSVDVRELSRLFSLETGPYADPEAVLARADAKLLDMSRSATLESYQAQQVRQAGGTDSDPATGVLGKTGFQAAVVRGFEASKAGGVPMSIVQLVFENLPMAEQSYGEAGRDHLLRAVATQLIKLFEPAGGVVCRVGAAVFAVVLPGCAAGEAGRLAESFRRLVELRSGDWAPPDAIERVYLTCAAGVGGFDGEAIRGERVESLVVGASNAVRAAIAAGGNRVEPPAARAA